MTVNTRRNIDFAGRTTGVRCPRPGTARLARRGFSLAEMIIAIFILGIGVISVVSLFPMGLTQQRRSTDAILGPTIANNALEVLRSKLSSDDFGWFGGVNRIWDASDPNDFIDVDRRYQLPSIVGDWGWRRPAFYRPVQPIQIPDQLNFSRWVSPGSVDIFRDVRAVDPNGTNTELPYNTLKYPISGPFAVPPPGFIFTQEERYFPQQSTEMLAASGEVADSPQYVWDCMFRRFQGRIEVAIFVYRVQTTGGGNEPFHVTFVNQDAPDFPPIPVYNLLDGQGPGLADNPWRGFGRDGDPFTQQDNAIIPGTDPDPANPFDPTRFSDGWQLPGQWIIDQNRNIHRVLNGRRNTADGPVVLTRAPEPVSFGRQVYIREQNEDGEIFELWYIPPVVVDPVTDREFRLTPVYATVKEL